MFWQCGGQQFGHRVKGIVTVSRLFSKYQPLHLIILFLVTYGSTACTTAPPPTPSPTQVAFITVSPTATPTPLPSATPTISLDISSPSPVTPVVSPLATIAVDTPTPTPTATLTSFPTVVTPTQPPTSTPDRVAPPAPQPINPIDGSQQQCPRDVQSVQVWLEWQPVSDPAGVHYVVDIVDDALAHKVGQKETALAIEAECGYRHAWQVRAIDGVGNESAWSSPQTFTLIRPDTTGPLRPTLRGPRDQSSLTCYNSRPVEVSFEWDRVYDSSGIADYQFVLEQRTPTSEVWQAFDKTETGMSLSLTKLLPCDYQYRWAVRARDQANNWGEWSRPASFYIETDRHPPAAPRPTYPANNATLNCSEKTRPVELAWTAVTDEAGIANYEIEMRQRYGAEDWPSTWDNNLYPDGNRTTYRVELQCGYRYAWRIRATDRQQNIGSWSTNWSYFYIE